MKNRILVVLIAASIGLISYHKSFAESEPTLIKMRITAYCLDGMTASGTPTRDGICATGRPGMLGKTVIVYRRLPGDEIGEALGIYEVTDTGCNENVIDIWRPTLDDCQSVMDWAYEKGSAGKIWVQVLENCDG